MKAPRPLPPVEFLRAILEYDALSGGLTWRPRNAENLPPGLHSPERKAAQWNARHAGRPAFTALGAAGYFMGAINGVGFLAHRVIWKLVTGDEPRVIDHRNGVRHDNRFSNLRETDEAGNMQNFPMRADNKSGVVGVYWCATADRWIAQIGAGASREYLGSFARIEDAIQSRAEAAARLGYLSGHLGAAA